MMTQGRRTSSPRTTKINLMPSGPSGSPRGDHGKTKFLGPCEKISDKSSPALPDSHVDKHRKVSRTPYRPHPDPIVSRPRNASTLALSGWLVRSGHVSPCGASAVMTSIHLIMSMLCRSSFASRRDSLGFMFSPACECLRLVPVGKAKGDPDPHLPIQTIDQIGAKTSDLLVNRSLDHDRRAFNPLVGHDLLDPHRWDRPDPARVGKPDTFPLPSMYL